MRLLHRGLPDDAALSDDQLTDLPRAFKGNLCRCTGYRAIEDAVRGIRHVEEPSPGESVGRSLPAPAGPQVVTGTARYTFDIGVPGLLHMKLLRSPHAHARITAIDTSAALRVPGVHAVLTHHDAPERHYSTARHEHPEEDPDDTRLLDDTVRYIGQRVAAVVADSEAAAEEGCRRIEVTYDVLPAVLDPEEAMRPVLPWSMTRTGRPPVSPVRGRTSSARRTVRSGTSRPGSPRPTSSTRTPSAPSGSSTPAWRRTAPSPGSTRTAGSPSAPARRRRSSPAALRSVHAADAGKVMNPMQCRGQVEGGIAQALGATLFENVRLDARGAVETAAFRRYRLPQYADVPRTEVHFMETADAIGPLDAKSMSESPFNPVAPAPANALRDATGVRFTELPLTRDRVWRALDAGRRMPRPPVSP